LGKTDTHTHSSEYISQGSNQLIDRLRRRRGEEEEEESLFKADAVNEEDSERDCATQV
jgi:hypothetical protein